MSIITKSIIVFVIMLFVPFPKIKVVTIWGMNQKLL